MTNEIADQETHLGRLPKAAIRAAAAKWRFVRIADLGANRSEGQLSAENYQPHVPLGALPPPWCMLLPHR